MDAKGRILIFSRTPHGCSRNFTDKLRFPDGLLTDAHGLSRTYFDVLIATSWTLTDEF